MILKKNFFYICHNHNFFNISADTFFLESLIPRGDEIGNFRERHRHCRFSSLAFETSCHIPPPAVAQRTASFLFITNDIRHNQVNQMDIIQRSIISVCFQPDSLEGHQTPTCPVRKTSAPLPEFGIKYLNSMSDTLILDKIMKSFT